MSFLEYVKRIENTKRNVIYYIVFLIASTYGATSSLINIIDFEKFLYITPFIICLVGMFMGICVLYNFIVREWKK